MNKPRVLLIDDDEAILSTVSTFLESCGYPVTCAQTGEEALEEVSSGRYPIVVSDIYIDRVTGLDILKTVRSRNPHAAVVLMTARGSVETTVEAEAGGAFDYLAKPFEMRHLLAVVERAAAGLAEAPAAPEEEAAAPYAGMVGVSPAAVEVYKQVARCARSEETVLIVGETGVGKELVARAIHDHSARAGAPFVALDCTAIQSNLWESEVFGSLRGAFTGADRDRAGVLEAARGGTVFFDEIGEIPLEFQAKLLRLMQDKEFRPVGASAPRRADVRILAATNRSLEQMRAQGSFREDLFYRLNVLRLEVPPLRERRADIPLLVRHFLKQAVAAANKQVWLEPGAMDALRQYAWPGNVRELENTMRRIVAMSPPGPVSAASVEQTLQASGALAEEPQTLADVEQRRILKALEDTGGNKSRAAKLLGIQRRTLYKKLARMSRGNFEQTQ